MRLSRFVTVSAVLFAVLCAGAAGVSAQDASQQKFGSINCPQKMPCPDSGEYISASGLAKNSNACLAGLGVHRDSSFFDESAGLDSSQCMSINSDLIRSKTSKTLLPKCCVMQLPDRSCIMHCDMLNNW